MLTRCAILAPALAALALHATASVTITVDIVDPSDGISQPPPGILCVDVLVDVTPGDSWTAGAVWVDAFHGARFVYAYGSLDPNDPPWSGLVNPGSANRFVSFVSEPRGRDADERFTDGG